MRAVTLVKLPNTPKFLGTFDDEFTSWWYSNPLPGAVDEIIDSTWTYGQYHVCIAKMLDGSHSIFQSHDYGVNWSLVLNLNYIIYTIARIDYGRLLAGTSNGVYESKNSGTTWSKISTTANLVTIKEVGNDRLVANDYSGNCYYSSNNGVSWSKSSFTEISAGGTLATKRCGTAKDCIDGQNGIVFIVETLNTTNIRLGYSLDHGQSYTTNYPNGWYYNNRVVQVWNMDTNPNGLYRKGPITKIICTGMSSNGFPTFVVQQRYGSVLRHYYAYLIIDPVYPESSYYTFAAKFDALESQATDLSAKEVVLVGKGTYYRTVVFTGANSDGTPRVMTSSNGGSTWIEQDVASATIYSGPDMTQEIGTGGAFLEDSYIATSWTGPVCHNSGSWFSDGHVQQGLSYEMDFLTRTAISREQSYAMDVYCLVPHIKTFHQDILVQRPYTKSYVFDALFRSPELFTYAMDILNEKALLKQFTMDILESKVCLEQYTFDILNSHFWTELYALDAWVEKVCLEQFTMDVISVFHFTKTFTMDSLLQKLCIKNLIMDVLHEGLNTDTFTMDIKIQDTIVPDILHNTERYHWQGAAIGIGYPRSSYPIFDSRKETKT